MVDIASGEVNGSIYTQDGKNAAAVALGRLGGRKGGAARAMRLSPEERKHIAEKAAIARWKKDV
jgi:hypothetical protein